MASSSSTSDPSSSSTSDPPVSSRSDVDLLKSELLTLKKGKSTMSGYLQKAKSIADGLAVAGSSVDSKELMKFVLKGLPPEYYIVKKVIRHSNKELMDFYSFFFLMYDEDEDEDEDEDMNLDSSSQPSSSETNSESSSETNSENWYLSPKTVDSHKFYDIKLDEMVRRLMRFSGNQKCRDCDTEGPQYVCTTLLSFVCKICKDIHQEFGHTVKSVSDRFTFEEVLALFDKRGNELMDEPETTLPDNSDVVTLRKFIWRRYVDGRSSDEEAYMEEEAQEKRRKAKEKAYEEEGRGRKRKIEEAAGLRETHIIKDLPALGLPPNEIVMKLRDLSRHAVGISETSKPLKPIVILEDRSYLGLPYPWKDLNIEQLARKGLGTVSGEVRCFKCGNTSEASLDWRDAWVKSASFMLANFISFGKDMYLSWTPPSDHLDIECARCTGMKLVPHIDPTEEMNWLFLFLTNTVSNVPASILEKYIRSRGIQPSGRPSKKELVWFLHLYMLGLLDPGVWAGFSLFAKTPRDDERSSE